MCECRKGRGGESGNGGGNVAGQGPLVLGMLVGMLVEEGGVVMNVWV
jgi:hypothetical protein